MRNTHPILASILLVLALPAAAGAQSLFQDEPEAPPARADGDRSAHESLYATSLIAVRPPDPREYHENDLITIEVSQISNIKREQSLDTEKKYTNEAALAALTTIRQFLELRAPLTAVNPSTSNIAETNVKFEGDGQYERKENITARITARVLEVKPNGTLLLEARSTVQTDKEKQTILLSGLCRSEDVTARNSISSSQLFDLALNIQHEGQVKKASEKGFIPRALEAIFNF
ncbi:MAG: flagellar basal body L-ring protein FlgH [Phycisphaeraceae bacterium]|nr:flagellar basal body L-ring protein FlgH [Phycisphaeraceae bacterium]MCB9847977.1 flagellar basal body L-ring protein FlgH [Phycisphaeraceae bacterium]